MLFLKEGLFLSESQSCSAQAGEGGHPLNPRPAASPTSHRLLLWAQEETGPRKQLPDLVSFLQNPRSS